MGNKEILKRILAVIGSAMMVGMTIGVAAA